MFLVTLIVVPAPTRIPEITGREVPALLKPLMIFPVAVTEVPPAILIPFAIGDTVPVALIALIALPEIVTVLPPITVTPLMFPEVPLAETEVIVFVETLVFDAPLIITPDTVDAEPVEDKLLSAFVVMLIGLFEFEQVIPVTFAPVPVEVRPVIVLDEKLHGPDPLKELPIVIPVIAPCEEIAEMVFVLMLFVPPMYVKFMQLIVPVPPVQLLRMFPVTVLFGLVPAPSVLLKPVIVVVPVTTIPEKLLLV